MTRTAVFIGTALLAAVSIYPAQASSYRIPPTWCMSTLNADDTEMLASNGALVNGSGVVGSETVECSYERKDFDTATTLSVFVRDVGMATAVAKACVHSVNSSTFYCGTPHSTSTNGFQTLSPDLTKWQDHYSTTYHAYVRVTLGNSDELLGISIQ
jgi:hypothetical protein